MVLTEQLNQTSNDGCESFQESEPKKAECEKDTSGRIFDIGAVISVCRVSTVSQFLRATKSIYQRLGGWTAPGILLKLSIGGLMNHLER
jgi:hypothetical protein